MRLLAVGGVRSNVIFVLIRFLISYSFFLILIINHEFSISNILIVELAAGLLVVAHNSAGPKEDIICQSRYLANTKEEYINKISTILKKSDS